MRIFVFSACAVTSSHHSMDLQLTVTQFGRRRSLVARKLRHEQCRLSNVSKLSLSKYVMWKKIHLTHLIGCDLMNK